MPEVSRKRKTQLKKLLSRDWLTIAVDNYLADVKDSGQPGPRLIHASWLSGEPVEIYKRLLGLDEHKPPSPGLRRKFDDGLDMQRRWLNYFRRMGILVDPRNPEDDDVGVEFVDQEYGIVGHMDCTIRTPQSEIVPVELKAMNSELYKVHKFAPKRGHTHQLQMYIHAMRLIYEVEPTWGYLLMESKDTQDFTPRRLNRKQEIIDAALEKCCIVWDWVKSGKDALASISLCLG